MRLNMPSHKHKIFQTSTEVIGINPEEITELGMPYDIFSKGFINISSSDFKVA